MQICLWTKFFALLELVALNTLASDVHVAVNVSQTNTVQKGGNMQTCDSACMEAIAKAAEAAINLLIQSLYYWENMFSYHIVDEGGECFWDDEKGRDSYAKVHRTCEHGRRSFYRRFMLLKDGDWYCAYNTRIVKAIWWDIPGLGLDEEGYECPKQPRMPTNIIPPMPTNITEQFGIIGPGRNGVTKKVAGGTPGAIRGVSSCYVCSDPTANCEKNCGTVIRCSDANPTLPPETEYVCTEVTAAGHVARGCLRKQEADMIFGDKDCAEGAQGQQKMCQCYTDVCNSGLLEGHDTCEA